MQRKRVNKEETGKRLKDLREHNFNLRKNVCRELRYNAGNCSGDCDKCRYEMDNSISRAELAKVFLLSESVIYNWEKGVTAISYEDLLLYVQLADVKIEDIVALEEEE